MKKKIVALVLVIALVASLAIALAACNDNGGNNDDGASINLAPDYSTIGDVAGKSIKVGIILIGDETEGYSEAHINGIDTAAEKIEEAGGNVEIIYKKSQGEDPANITNSADELIAAGCTLVITNSYGHEAAILPVARANPNITFIAMTGDQAAKSGLSNLKNAFTKIFESRYVAGVVAGYKLKELVDGNKLGANNYDAQGNIKIGYVGAFSFQEVVSGYTAFYLGIKSIVPNVVMSVQYTNSWFDPDGEQQAAANLISQGCVIISQHADSYGAPTACENAAKNGTLVYCVGYNVSMLEAAPHAALTSATNDWSVYYAYAISAAMKGETIATDWAHGYDKGAVGITAINEDLFENDYTEEFAAVVAALHDGTTKVFDCSKFTVNGEHLTTYTGAYNMNGAECIKTENGITYFDESVLRAAPYFDLRIDGITEL